MEIKPILWNRILECGHSRTTATNFIMGIYGKPIINSKCYCRECQKEVRIIKVEEVKQNGKISV